MKLAEFKEWLEEKDAQYRQIEIECFKNGSQFADYFMQRERIATALNLIDEFGGAA